MQPGGIYATGEGGIYARGGLQICTILPALKRLFTQVSRKTIYSFVGTLGDHNLSTTSVHVYKEVSKALDYLI